MRRGGLGLGLGAAGLPVSTWFQRRLLPGLAYKAVVIGGGYATGRELAEFFLPSGPWGGIAAMALAMLIWSAICVTTFLFARACGALDYRTFIRALLGPGWIAFEVVYVLFVVLVLAVFGAAAGAIGAATLGVPTLVGTIALMAAIALVTAYGNPAVERLFAYVSFLLYGVYVLFVVFSLSHFGGRIVAAFGRPAPLHGWVAGGVQYASYNVIGAVVILPVLRHLTSKRDAVIAGIVAGPLAMLPALMFFSCMMAFYPQIAGATLPSDYLLQRLDLPVFRFLFQLMIFAALLESGTGFVHAINERIGLAWRRHNAQLGRWPRLGIALVTLVFCMLLAERFGLVTLIARGYRLFAYVVLLVFVVPLFTVGLYRLLTRRVAPQGIV